MERCQFEPSVLGGLLAIRQLRGVRGGAREGVTLGSCTTLSAVAVHPEIAAHYPALATAAGLVSSPQLRNMGTIGGNVCVDTRCNYYNQSYEWRKAVGFCMERDGAICLVAPRSPRCWAVSSSDTAPVLWGLGARVRLRSAAGERTIPVETLFRDDGIEYLAKRPDEILTDILLPPADGWRSAYLKLRRRGSFDFPVLGGRIKGLRAERELQQRQLAEKADLTPSMVSQIESGRLTPSLHTLGRIAAALGVPIGALFDGQPAGSIVVTRRKDYPVVSFDGSSERWAVLGAGLFQGKIRAVVSTLGPRERGVTTEKVIIKPGQMKLFYVIDGKVALHYNGDRHLLEAGDSALLDGGTPHGWENLGTKRAQALWVILG